MYEKRKRWPVAIFLLVCAGAATWQWGFKANLSSPMSYGPGDLNNFIRPATLAEGQSGELCLHGARWLRTDCHSELITSLTPKQGERLDLPRHVIDTPAEPQVVPDKCRPWTAPHIGSRMSPMVLSGFVESLCPARGLNGNTVRIITEFPKITVTITKAP